MSVVIDDGVAQHFGNPIREQRDLVRGSAIAPRADRAVISLTGPDRLTWLDSITSQAVAKLAPAGSSELLVLDPNGRIEHAVSVFDDGATTWLIVDAQAAALLERWFTMMRFRAAVEIARPQAQVVGFFRGGEAEQAVTSLALAPAERAVVWDDPWPEVATGGWQYAVTDEHPGADFVWSEAVLPAEAELPPTAPLAGALAVDALRIAAWRPRWVSEVDERAIPHETDWLRTAVHLAKGCYRGQETVAKVHNLGHPPRRLVLLHLDGSDDVLPSAGDAVKASATDEVSIGQVTSVGRHYELGPIALAVVSRRAPVDAPLMVVADGHAVAATQEVIVPGDAGSTANVPRLPRLSRRRAAEK